MNINIAIQILNCSSVQMGDADALRAAAIKFLEGQFEEAGNVESLTPAMRKLNRAELLVKMRNAVDNLDLAVGYGQHDTNARIVLTDCRLHWTEDDAPSKRDLSIMLAAADDERQGEKQAIQAACQKAVKECLQSILDGANVLINKGYMPLCALNKSFAEISMKYGVEPE